MITKSEKRLAELMEKSFDELMESELMGELRTNYPEGYKEKLKEISNAAKPIDQEEAPEPIDYERLAGAIKKNWEELMESGDSELLRKSCPEVYRMKFNEEFGYDPK